VHPTSDLPVTGNTVHTRPENRAFYPALDGLRAVAFLLVFLQHYLAVPWGWTGVDIFFVLSGFLITGILFDTRNDPHRVRNFYLRRTLRIFPLYYGVMAIILLLYPLFRWDINWQWLAWPAYLGNYLRFLNPSALIDGSPLQQLADFQPNATHPANFDLVLFLGHFWSLCVEEQFYLFWPWLVFWVRDRRTLLWICAFTLPLCLALRIAGQQHLPAWMLAQEVLNRATPFRLDALLLGGLLALLLRGPLAAHLLRYARMLSPLVLVVIVYWLYAVATHCNRAMEYPAWKFTYGLTLIDLIAAFVILIAIQPGTLLFRALGLRPLRWLGRISYGAYVLHDIPHVVYFSFAATLVPAYPSLATSALALAATLFLAWLSFRYLESPFLELKERWTVG
jgi:peptidoglycan/LPS O-acetylase OafA/YrhL